MRVAINWIYMHGSFLVPEGPFIHIGDEDLASTVEVVTRVNAPPWKPDYLHVLLF
jgi:hypothetical protein